MSLNKDFNRDEQCSIIVLSQFLYAKIRRMILIQDHQIRTHHGIFSFIVGSISIIILPLNVLWSLILQHVDGSSFVLNFTFCQHRKTFKQKNFFQ